MKYIPRHLLLAALKKKIFPDTSVTNICDFPALVSIFHLSFFSRLYLIFPAALIKSSCWPASH